MKYILGFSLHQSLRLSTFFPLDLWPWWILIVFFFLLFCFFAVLSSLTLSQMLEGGRLWTGKWGLGCIAPKVSTLKVTIQSYQTTLDLLKIMLLVWLHYWSLVLAHWVSVKMYSPQFHSTEVKVLQALLYLAVHFKYIFIQIFTMVLFF